MRKLIRIGTRVNQGKYEIFVLEAEDAQRAQIVRDFAAVPPGIELNTRVGSIS